MVMAKAKTVAQAQNLCCFMDGYPLAGPSLPLFLYYTKLTWGMQSYRTLQSTAINYIIFTYGLRNLYLIFIY